MVREFDLLVIGAGMAGVEAANKCAARGWRVAIVDELPYGGTCALRGCDPKKILRRSAEVIEDARWMAGNGVDAHGLQVNWGDLMAHKRGFTDPMPKKIEAGLTANGVTTLHGEAVFTGARAITVGGTTHVATRFLIATGARPRPQAFPGSEHLTDSTKFLTLDTLPPRIVFLGGGLISFEFAHLAARAGSSPIIVDHGQGPLRGFDADLVELLVNYGSAQGIDVRAATTISRIEKTPAGYRVVLDQHGTSVTVEADLVVHGAGREADLSRLQLEIPGVAWGPRGVTVAAHLQSVTNPAVWAAGDSADTQGPPLTPVAVFEGKVAAGNMLAGSARVPDYTGVPMTVFTIPELTRVGMSEADANDHGLKVDVRYSNTSSWYSNYRVGAPVGAAKILIDRATDHIVGAHLFGNEYGELINVLALAMKVGLTTRQLKSAVTSYPSVGSDLGSLL